MTKEETKGLSKNELKKLKKKEEKAAKKAAGTKPGGNTETTAGVGNTPPTEKSPSSNGGWSIVFPNDKSAATIKVVWASQAFNVDLQAAKNSVCNNHLVATTQQPAIVPTAGPRNFITGDGNAMAQAVVTSSANNNNTATTSVNFMDRCAIDEWCEWERVALRAPAPSSSALQHLEKSLTEHHTPLHLVGEALSLADICVVTTLASMPSVDALPPAVDRFVQAHLAGYQAAVQQAAVLQEQSSSSSTVSSSIDMNEPSLLKVVDAVFREIVAHVFGPELVLPSHIVKPCQNIKHGDYQFSAAMPIFAALKKTNNTSSLYDSPQQVANAVVEAVGTTDHPVLMDLQVQGPGFVLCRLQPAFLQHHVNLFLQSNKLAMPKLSKHETCVVDFSSPNIAKEMHVGHLRSTIIGEAVCRILEAAGHTVHRVNHVGDWGTQFGMLIQYLKEEYPEVVGSENDDAELPNITDLTLFYKNAKKRFDTSAEFKKTSQMNVVKLQSGDAECMKIWKMLCDVSRKEFQKVYNRLDVSCEEFGESFYNAKIPPVIEEFDKAGKIKIEEGGAKCVFLDKFQIPLMLQKSDGGFGYDSTDMAALRYRLKDLKADRIIVITDYSQGDHFKMVYEAGHDIGWVDKGQRLEHIGFGTVQGFDGKRFQTRSGETVRLVDLLDEAVNRMEADLRVRIEEGKANITVEEVHEVAEAIGYGAIKYYDLRRNPTSNYKFSYDQMLDTKGDTAVYLLYARVRLESIAAKAASELGVDVDDLLKAGETIEITHPSERNLALHLQLFADVMEQTLDDLYPYHICEYVYKLATAASDFVTQCRVLGSPEMKSRVLLCYATTNAMHQCFDLLGIRHVKRI